MDATTVKEPGPSGSLWRLHYSVGLPSLTCDFFKLTGTEGPGTGESLAQFPIRVGDHVLADRGYSTARGIRHVVDAGGRLIVRVTTGSLKLPRFRGHLSSWGGEGVSAMPKTRPPYAAEFRQQMVDLVRSGRAPEDLAREFEPSSQAIRTWVAQVGRDAGERSDGLRTEEREELRRLRRENRRLREEREILAKATAWFAREARPGRPTGS